MPCHLLVIINPNYSLKCKRRITKIKRVMIIKLSAMRFGAYVIVMIISLRMIIIRLFSVMTRIITTSN